MKYYKLFIDKEKRILKLSLTKETDVFYKESVKYCFDNLKMYKYNNCYMFCTNRRILKDYAENLKDLWINEHKQIIQDLERMKI